jgi:hypothetical protein
MSSLSRKDPHRRAFRSHREANNRFAQANPGNVVFTGSENNTNTNRGNDPYATYARIHRSTNNQDPQSGTKKTGLERSGAIYGRRNNGNVVRRSTYFLKQSRRSNTVNVGGARKKTRKHKKQTRKSRK